VDVSIAPASDLSRVRSVVEEIGDTLPDRERLLAGPPAVKGVTAVDGAKMTVRVVAPAQPGRQQEVEMALRSALLERLSAAEIRLV
jgi:hypothetical protein